jgi:hypothetical protein
MYQHHSDSDRKVLVTSRYQDAAGLLAIKAVHSESRGPAVSRRCFLPYVSFDAALNDAARLSPAMSGRRHSSLHARGVAAWGAMRPNKSSNRTVDIENVIATLPTE